MIEIQRACVGQRSSIRGAIAGILLGHVFASRIAIPYFGLECATGSFGWTLLFTPVTAVLAIAGLRLGAKGGGRVWPISGMLAGAWLGLALDRCLLFYGRFWWEPGCDLAGAYVGARIAPHLTRGRCRNEERTRRGDPGRGELVAIATFGMLPLVTELLLGIYASVRLAVEPVWLLSCQLPGAALAAGLGWMLSKRSRARE